MTLQATIRERKDPPQIGHSLTSTGAKSQSGVIHSVLGLSDLFPKYREYEGHTNNHADTMRAPSRHHAHFVC